MASNQYAINVAWSDEDAGFVAKCSVFPYMAAFGKTQKKAVAEAQNTINGFLEILQEDGVAPPKPKKLQKYSGQVRIRMPKDLHANLAADAEKNNVSLNTQILVLLAENRGVEKTYNQSIEDLQKIVNTQENISTILGRIGQHNEEESGISGVSFSGAGINVISVTTPHS